MKKNLILGVSHALRVKPPKTPAGRSFSLQTPRQLPNTPDNRDFCVTEGAKIYKCHRLPGEGYVPKNPLTGSRGNRTLSQMPYQNNHTPSVPGWMRLVVFVFSLCVFISCAAMPQWGKPKNTESGVATYNAEEPGLRAAHAELELATRVRVTNLNNNRAVIVTITDRIPADPYRTIHIGKLAGDNIEMSHTSPTPVVIEVLGRPKYASILMFPTAN